MEESAVRRGRSHRLATAADKSVAKDLPPSPRRHHPRLKAEEMAPPSPRVMRLTAREDRKRSIAKASEIMRQDLFTKLADCDHAMVHDRQRELARPKWRNV